MEGYGWGMISTKENKRGRDSVIFNIDPNIMTNDRSMKKLLLNGVSRTDLQESLALSSYTLPDEQLTSQVHLY